MINRVSRQCFPVVLSLMLAVGTIAACWIAPLSRANPAPPDAPEASSESVHRMCGACHAYPPPDTFPRGAWRKEVRQAYDFFHQDPSFRFPYPPLEETVAYYESRAPLSLEIPARADAPHPCPARFERMNCDVSTFSSSTVLPGVANVSIVNLSGRPEILVCDALSNQVLLINPRATPPRWRVIASGFCCAHAEVVDLDGDGISDIVLACLGSFYATDDLVGSVVWLRGAKDGSFTPITLLDGIGRVADVRPARFTDSGKIDLVVAEFGWHQTGSILLLENKTSDWSKPTFVPRVLDRRHGTTQVPVADLNGDGKPDFVAVISQEHETVVAFLNEGGGRFRKETIYQAPHPTWGCDGVQLVDLDGDGDLDVILSNGDSLDAPYILKPYHGVTWLENKGTYPFTPHRLADCPGAISPIVADFDGNGLLDVVFSTFLPADSFPQRGKQDLEALVLLEQVSKGKFVRHTLELEACDHLSCAAGDLFGSGRPDLVVGNYVRGGPAKSALTIWRNTTAIRPKK